MTLPKEITDINAINELGPTFVGLQLFQLLDIIDFQGNEILAERGITVPSRSTSTMIYLRRNDSVTVTRLARFLGMSHQLVSHRIKDLKAHRLVIEKRDPDDLRRTQIVLTKSGNALARQIELLCEEIEVAYLELFEEIGVDLFDALIKAKSALAERGFAQRISQTGRKFG